MRTLRQVTPTLWLVVEEVSEVVLMPELEDGLTIVMNNGNVYCLPIREGATAETMIKNLFTGEHA